MFSTVKRFRPLIYVLVAAQLLLSAPVVSALSAASSAEQMPCGDMMPAGSDSDHCPCCPDGVTSMGECLSACTAAHAAARTPTLFVPVTISSLANTPAFVPLVMLADPPVQPPPIH